MRCLSTKRSSNLLLAHHREHNYMGFWKGLWKCRALIDCKSWSYSVCDFTMAVCNKSHVQISTRTVAVDTVFRYDWFDWGIYRRKRYESILVQPSSGFQHISVFRKPKSGKNRKFYRGGSRIWVWFFQINFRLQVGTIICGSFILEV